MIPDSLSPGGCDQTNPPSLPTPTLPDAASPASTEVEAASVSSEPEQPPVPSQSDAGRAARAQGSRPRGRLSAPSSAASDFRSVIDDLTLENRRLKEELKRFQQTDSPAFHMDQSLEVKCHGLDANGKRDLESVLRNFATSSKGSSPASLPRKKASRARANKSSTRSSSSGLRSGRGSSLAHAPGRARQSSSAASPLCGPVTQQAGDNADHNPHPSLASSRSPLVGLGENDKKELVVRRLEQLFTGKPLGLARHGAPPLMRATTSEELGPTSSDGASRKPTSREAHIDPNTKQYGLFSPISNNYRLLSRDSSGSFGSSDVSPLKNGPPEQRATRPHELDPHRFQSSTQNMDYIRHLGFGMPEPKPFSARDVSPESDGWVHLNLLGSMAQLSVLCVTPAFIRSAVAEKSDMLQLSSDGQRVHWRGGTEGTKFASDSGTNDGNRPRAGKRQKMSSADDDEVMVSRASPASPRRKEASTDAHFHYRPMFAHRNDTFSEQLPERASSPVDDMSSTSAWPRERKASDALLRSDIGSSCAAPRKRSRDGAIYFYAGAPFYTDLSGDRGICEPKSSPSPSSDDDKPGSQYRRAPTGLSDPSVLLRDMATDQPATNADVDLGGLDEEDDDSNSDDISEPPLPTKLESSGLAGVVPRDHFVVSISTRQRKVPCDSRMSFTIRSPVERSWNCAGMAKSVAAQRVSKAVSSVLNRQLRSTTIKISVEYMGGKVQELPPVPPPPAVHILSSDSSSESASASDSDGDECFSWGKESVDDNSSFNFIPA